MPIKIANENFYKVAETVEMTGISKVTIFKFFKRGLLDGKKVGNKWFISEENLKKLFSNSKNTTGGDK